MNIYYHCLPQEDVQRVLKEGIKPGKQIGIQRHFRGIPVDNNYLYLWKNLNILDGEVYHGLLSDGCLFLKVTVPETHPIERDLDAKILLQNDPLLLIPIMNLLKIDFKPTDYLDSNAIMRIKRYANENRSLPKMEMIRGSSRIVCEELVKNRQTINTILQMSTDENWDSIIGFYRTTQTIPPTPPYNIEGYH